MTTILAQIPRTERIETHVELARWSSGNALLVGAAFTIVALYAVAWMYRREARGLITPRLRWSLVACRIAVLFLLGLIGLEPVIVNYIHRRLDACTLVLADSSASMSLADSYRRTEDARRVESVLGRLPSGGVVRVNLEETLLSGRENKFVRGLSAHNTVKVLTFSDQLGDEEHKVSSNHSSAAISAPTSQPTQIRPTGPATDVSAAIRAGIDQLGGQPVAGVVLLSDGGFNRGELPDAVARMLKQRGIPLYAVGIGDPAEPINVAVTEVSAPRTAFKDDPFSVTVRLVAQNTGDQPIQVELLEHRARSAEPAKVVATRTVVAPPAGAIEPLSFERKVAEPGEVSYIARAAALTGEAVASDNQREILPAVQILDDQMRVLIVAGSPSYDYRFLTRMLERDKTVNVSTWLQSADAGAVRDGDTVITELPTRQEDLFQYDAILMIDPDPEEFEPIWASLVATFVTDHGGGLLYAAGNKYSGRFFRSPKTQSILELLPVLPEPDAEIILNELGQYQVRSWPVIVPESSLSDPILRQADNAAENRQIWSMLEGVYWHFPVHREKPLATVLMRHSNPRMANTFGPHVLMATQLVGAGRSAFVGFNSTWRWRRDDEKYFNRFWIQTLRYLVEGKLLGGRSRGVIISPKDQYELGEAVEITVRALNESFNPLVVPELELAVTRNVGENEGGTRAEAQPNRLTPIPDREGYYQGRFVPDGPGTYRLQLKLPGRPTTQPAGEDPPTQKQIVVRPSDIEMQNTAMNRAALSRLAAMSGGKYFDIDETDRLAGMIPDGSRTYVTRERPRPLWDNSYVLILLVGVLTIEWILRKKAKLL
jgi:hypothetical protein